MIVSMVYVGFDPGKDKCGLAIVQERTTCVIPGMPDSALRTAGADEVVALLEMHHAIERLVSTQAELAHQPVVRSA